MVLQPVLGCLTCSGGRNAGWMGLSSPGLTSEAVCVEFDPAVLALPVGQMVKWFVKLVVCFSYKPEYCQLI